MPEEAIQEKLTFKSEEERLQALNKVESDAPSSVTNEDEVNAWVKKQEEEQNRIMEAEIVPEPPSPEDPPPESQVPEDAPPEPQVPEEPPVEETQISPKPAAEEPPAESPLQEEDLIQFSYKHSDLPESLKGYKNPEEIIKQADHARTYANKAERKMKETEAEKEKMAAKLKEYEDLKAQDVSKAPEASKPETPQPETNDLTAQIQKIESMEDTDYLGAGEVKNVFNLVAKQLAETKKAADDLKAELGGKLTNIQKVNEENAKKDEATRQKEAVVRSINELQDAYPELKTNKPVAAVMGQTDCVERDVEKFADQLLFSKWGNDKPDWTQRNAVVNAFLEGNPEITAYCQQNAITPESVGTTADDIKKYATIMNVDANMRGEEIDRVTGERKQKISPFNGKPVNFESHIASYKNLKDAAGITQEEQQKEIAEAEIKGQQSLSEAMETRADAPRTLGDKGSAPPETVKEMGEEAAWKLIDNVDEMKMEQEALLGNRSYFHEFNKAQKTVGFSEAEPMEHWPPEKK